MSPVQGNGVPPSQREFAALQNDVDYMKGQVIRHDSAIEKINQTLQQIRRGMSNLETELHELNNWKEDSKVQEIALLRGKLKKIGRFKSRVFYAVLLAALAEGVRVAFEKIPFFHH
jgi:septal ring factor EnvC (AmiA/AmiB activator)